MPSLCLDKKGAAGRVSMCEILYAGSMEDAFSVCFFFFIKVVLNPKENTYFIAAYQSLVVIGALSFLYFFTW